MVTGSIWYIPFSCQIEWIILILFLFSVRVRDLFSVMSDLSGAFPFLAASWCLLSAAASLKMRIWIPSRRLNESVRGGWLTTLANASGCETSTKPSRSSVACASCTWKARSPRLSCSSSIRLWPSYLAWSSKSEVSVAAAAINWNATSHHISADS